MDRLSPLDASFLYLEGARTPMHISSLAIYEGPAPAHDELKAMLERRLPRIPRFRQKLAKVPLAGHRPMWIDDEAFDLDAHLCGVALFEASDDALLQLTGRILAQPLCRTRPLWEMWLITGLSRGRFAVLSKTHHSLYDGISGIDLHAVLLDDSPHPAPDTEPEIFEPEPEPSGLGMLFRAAADRVQDAVTLTRAVVDSAKDPTAAIDNATRLVKDASSFAASMLSPAPACDLNGRIGSRRRFVVARGPLDHVKDMKHTLGASVNDVILASVAGAIRDWQMHRGSQPQDVKAMVPVSVRCDDEELGGNRVAMVVVTLPVADRTPLMRLDRVHSAMESAKSSGHIAAGEAIMRMSAFMPPAGIAALSRAQSVMRPFNLVVTNIPGPQTPLFLCGRKLLELFPQAPLASNQGLSVAALSYDGKIGFGLLADHDSMADVDVLAQGLEASLDELLWAGAVDAAAPQEPPLSQLADLAAVR